MTRARFMLLAGCLAAACGSRAPEAGVGARFVPAEPVLPEPEVDSLIAAVLPLSGVDAEIGLEMRRGIELALHGQNVSIRIEDNESNRIVTERVGVSLQRSKTLRGVIGDTNLDRSRGLENVIEPGIKLLAPGTGTAGIRQALVASWFAHERAWSNAVIVEDGSTKLTVDAFSGSFLGRGGILIAQVTAAQLAALSLTGVDVVVVIGSHGEIARVAETVHALAPSLPVIGIADLGSLEVSIAPSIADLYLVEPFALTTDEAMAFAQAYRDAYGLEPTISAVIGFDSVSCLRAELEDEADEPDATVTLMRCGGGYPGWDGMELIEHSHGAVSYLGRY